MHIVFLTALIALTCLFVLRYAEMMRGTRLAAVSRARLDAMVLRAYERVRSHTTVVHEHVNRDQLVKLLHMFTYLVLLLVRWLERKLTDANKFLRSFRKKKAARGISPGLEKVVRGVDAE